MKRRSSGTSTWLWNLPVSEFNRFEPVVENVGHGDELDRRTAHGERIGGGAGATATAADEGDFGRVVFGRVDERNLMPARAETAAVVFRKRRREGEAGRSLS